MQPKRLLQIYLICSWVSPKVSTSSVFLLMRAEPVPALSYRSACAVTLGYISHLWSVQPSIKERSPKSAALQWQRLHGSHPEKQPGNLRKDLMDHDHHHDILIQLCTAMFTVCLSSTSEVTVLEIRLLFFTSQKQWFRPDWSHHLKHLVCGSPAVTQAGFHVFCYLEQLYLFYDNPL